MAEDSVNIRIKKDTWRELHSRKEPNDSFDDVIQRLIQNMEDNTENANGPPTARGEDSSTRA